jgi:uncharacterized membrane protein
MTDSLQLIICTFDGADKAEDVKQTIVELDKKSDAIKLGNIAVVEKNDQGEIEFSETQDRRERLGGIAESVVGGATWLLYNFAGMLGPVAGATAGSQAKYAVERFASDSGFPDGALREIGEQLNTGHSALITLVKPEERPIVLAELERLGGHLVDHELPGHVVAKLSGSTPSD